MAGPSLEGILNPDLLLWAREASRMDLATAAKRAGVSEEKLQAWEEGKNFPTLRQLRLLASAYKRSVGVFFLNERPAASLQPADFRRLELSATHLMSAELANGIRLAETKREAALDIYTQWEEEPPAFSLALDLSLAPEDLAQRLSDRIGISMKGRGGWSTEYDALNAWKTAIESLGVLVMQVSGVAVSEMRGCSLAIFPLPIIMLNSSDRPLGRVFSLLHELVHLARAESGLCDVVEEQPRGYNEQAVEAYCNRIAGAVLVPFPELLQHSIVANAPQKEDWSRDELLALRKSFWASREVILRRLLMAGRTTQGFYEAERERMRQQFAATDEGETSGGFATFPRRVVLANGRFLTSLVVEAYDASVITGSELSRILGAKLDHLPKILDVLREREAA